MEKSYIPDVIKNNKIFRQFTRLTYEGEICEMYRREPTPQDKEREFYGEWKPVSEEEIKALNEKINEKKNKKSPNEVIREETGLPKPKREAKKLTEYEKQLAELRKALEEKLNQIRDERDKANSKKEGE